MNIIKRLQFLILIAALNLPAHASQTEKELTQGGPYQSKVTRLLSSFIPQNIKDSYTRYIDEKDRQEKEAFLYHFALDVMKVGLECYGGSWFFQVGVDLGRFLTGGSHLLTLEIDGAKGFDAFYKLTNLLKTEKTVDNLQSIFMYSHYMADYGDFLLNQYKDTPDSIKASVRFFQLSSLTGYLGCSTYKAFKKRQANFKKWIKEKQEGENPKNK